MSKQRNTLGQFVPAEEKPFDILTALSVKKETAAPKQTTRREQMMGRTWDEPKAGKYPWGEEWLSVHNDFLFQEL